MDDIKFILEGDMMALGPRLAPDHKAPLDTKARWEDNVARFCFAAARMPAPVLEGFLQLLETYEESQDIRVNGPCGHA
ncbi:hypothetical protein [Gimibacter soli]|uniref:Uncharacterized protein n=1 Tax=Gimibacter soli TaxID=3024400 RepID=A0AAF0BM84_9PROT|nr:hypothetical protein [Gimibacter soli]WCL54181.1 hypothetical protein PH603_00220 [Gimibacter soli]